MPDNNIAKSNIPASGHLFAEIRQILIGARQTAYKAVNFAMVTAYWNIGRLIVEDEQQGSTRAEYGKAVLADLSVRLTEEFGKGFDERELRRIRQFYLVPKMGRTASRIVVDALPSLDTCTRRGCSPMVYERSRRADVEFTPA